MNVAELKELARAQLALGSPIEVWLRQDNMAIACMVVREDESTAELEIHSLSMRGAQREITGFLVGKGYEPVGRWHGEFTPDDQDPTVAIDLPECSRRFKLKADA